MKSLGTFASAAEAALAYARHLRPVSCAAATTPPLADVKEEHSVPQMPPNALVKEEELEDAPAMPSDALVKTEVVPPMPSDAQVKTEASPPASGKKRPREA